MTKKEILELINTNKDSYSQIIKSHHREFYDNVVNKYVGVKFGEKLYRWLYEGNVFGKCLNCQKETRFQSIVVGFVKYCSKKCANIATAEVRGRALTHDVPNPNFWIEKQCKLCGKSFFSFIKRNGVFCSNECSAKFTGNDKTRLNKIRETKLERYGNETFVNPEKAKITCLEKYGVDNASKSDIVKKKIIQSNQIKYGVDYSWQSEEVKQKIQKTNLEKCGFLNPSSSPIIKKRRDASVYKKYGVFNVFQNPNTVKSIINTNLLRYNVEYSNQNPIIREKITDSNRISTYNRNKNKLDYVEFLFDASEFKGIDREYVYKFQCKKCGKIFEDNMDGNEHPRCLICNPYIQGFSIGEKEVLEFIKEILPGDTIIEKSRSIIDSLELDVYLPSKNVAIEFDGLYWHGEIGGKKDIRYHLIKTEKCKEKNIKLIHIFEDEWLFKKDIIKEKLKHILGKCNNLQKVYARNCVVKTISTKDKNDFLEKTHIQGKCNSSIKLGLYFDDSLMCVMTLNNLRIALGGDNTKTGEYELVRYATSKHVIGGCGKLLAYFVKNYNPTKIISYADRRYSNINNMYEKIGFKLESITNPNYWYFKPGYILKYHRFNFRKSELSKKLPIFDSNLTEWQNMQLNGYDRIWDCGQFKYEYNPTNIIHH